MTYRFFYATMDIIEIKNLSIRSTTNHILLIYVQGSVMMIYEVTHNKNISDLFGKWEETLIWSCLQGIMGKLYADDFDYPTAVMAILGDFTFFTATRQK